MIPRLYNLVIALFTQKLHISSGTIDYAGEVQEWLNWPLSKSGKVKAFEGSNPSLSAKYEFFVQFAKLESITLKQK